MQCREQLSRYSAIAACQTAAETLSVKLTCNMQGENAGGDCKGWFSVHTP